MKAPRLLEQDRNHHICTAHFVTDHVASRIPADIPFLKCPKGTGNLCVEIHLPWNVSFHSSSTDDGFGGNNLNNQHHQELEYKIIYVPSGCYQNVNKKSSSLTPKTEKSPKKSSKQGSSPQSKHSISSSSLRKSKGFKG